jgi:LysM repeat protein
MAKELLNRILHSPFGFQLASLTFLVLFLTSFKPPYSMVGQTFSDMSYYSLQTDFLPIVQPGFLENSIGVNTAGMREILVDDGHGKMIKKRLPKKRTNAITYVVKSGDNPSKIAHKFGIKVSTLNWANDLTAHSALQIARKLIIPPTDGVYYKVQKRETLSEIAKIHDIDLQKIRIYNPQIKKDIIKVGQNIFLPEAQRLYVQKKPVQELVRKITGGKIYHNPGFATNVKSTVAYKPYQSTITTTGLRLRRPTKGILTQGFRQGHYAIDIASKMNTPIYAAMDGVVRVSSAGKWNWGYGNYIIIDHGDGVETLYAHNNILKVAEGDTVRKGQLISLMGNTGKVRGVTGIHLHFELRIRGRKVNPQIYFQ